MELGPVLAGAAGPARLFLSAATGPKSDIGVDVGFALGAGVTDRTLLG